MRSIFAGKGFLKPPKPVSYAVFRRFQGCTPFQTEVNLLRTPAFRILIPAALLLILGTQDGFSQEGRADLPTVAVLDFTGFLMGEGGNSVPLGKAVSSMLVTELSGREGLRVIERQELQSILTEQRLALSGRVDESTAIQVGRLVGAQYVILGQVSSIGETTRMDMRAVDVETSEVLEVQKLLDETSELLSMVVRIADIFSQKLKLDAPAARPQMEAIPVQATIAFSRGVDFEDKGDKEKAIEQYREALRIHPNHRDAQKALDRLIQGGGEDR